MPPKTRILGLFPDLLANGGVQEAGRQTAAALSAISAAHGWTTEYLALNDPPGPQTFPIRDSVIPFTGFHRAKFHFVFAAARAARRDVRPSSPRTPISRSPQPSRSASPKLENDRRHPRDRSLGATLSAATRRWLRRRRDSRSEFLHTRPKTRRGPSRARGKFTACPGHSTQPFCNWQPEVSLPPGRATVTFVAGRSARPDP